MRRAAATGRYVTPSTPGSIRPAADSRPGSGEAMRTAKQRASRARRQIAAFKSAHR